MCSGISFTPLLAEGAFGAGKVSVCTAVVSADDIFSHEPVAALVAPRCHTREDANKSRILIPLVCSQFPKFVQCFIVFVEFRILALTSIGRLGSVSEAEALEEGANQLRGASRAYVVYTLR